MFVRYVYERHLSDFLLEETDPTSTYYDVFFWVDLIDDSGNGRLVDSNLVGTTIQLTDEDDLDWGSIDWDYCEITDESSDKVAEHEWSLT